MFTKVETSPRRHGRRDFLTLGAAAVAVVAGIGTVEATIGGNDAELLAMITEEQRLRDIGTALDNKLHRLIRAQSPEMRLDLYRLIEDDRCAEPIASAYAESARYIDAADEIGIRIEAATPKTIAGAVALLEWANSGDSPVTSECDRRAPSHCRERRFNMNAPDERDDPDDNNPRGRLGSALIRMRGICAVLEELAEGGDEKALLYLVNRFNEDCEAARSAYDELFDFRRAAQ